VPCTAGLAESDSGLPGNDASTDEVKDLTLQFLFEDPDGPKATGPNGSASRPKLGLVVNANAVKKTLWPSRKAEIKQFFFISSESYSEVDRHCMELIMLNYTSDSIPTTTHTPKRHSTSTF
jgi:hypothetical protein